MSVCLAVGGPRGPFPKGQTPGEKYIKLMSVLCFSSRLRCVPVGERNGTKQITSHSANVKTETPGRHIYKRVNQLCCRVCEVIVVRGRRGAAKREGLVDTGRHFANGCISCRLFAFS